MTRRGWLAGLLGGVLVGCTGPDDVALPAGAPVRTARLRWHRNPEATVTGYRLYVGRQSGRYDFAVNVGDVTVTTYVLFHRGRWVFALTALSTKGESAFSPEITVTA